MLAEDPEDGRARRHARHRRARATLTPQGRYRAAVTDSPDFVWSLPDTGVPQALDRGGQRGPTPPARRRSPPS